MSKDRNEKVFADIVASLCYKHFSKLPKKGKPQHGKEWTILAAIVVQMNGQSLRVVSLGTGSKCIGQGKLSAAGDLLNDSHAEISARRGFLRYLYHQLNNIYTGKASDIFTLNISSRQCSLKPGIDFIFFSSHTPCGDASIIPINNDLEEELQPCQISSNEEEPANKKPRLDHDIHRTGAKCAAGGFQDPKLPGMEHHIAGVLRTKPGRGIE